MKERKYITFDWALKRVFRDKANFDILEGFLSDLIGEDVQVLELLESESNKESSKDKHNRVDIKVRLGKKEIVVIELQYQYQDEFLHRLYYGASKAVTEQLTEAKDYGEIKRVILIGVIYFTYGASSDYIYEGETRFLGRHDKKELSLTKGQQELYGIEKVSDIFTYYYLILLYKFPDVVGDKFDEWLDLLKNEKLAKKPRANKIQEAAKRFEVLQMSPSERREFERHLEDMSNRRSFFANSYGRGMRQGEAIGLEKGEAIGLEKGEAIGLEKGEAIGLEKGEAIGEAKKAREIAISLIGELEDSIIAEKTGLSIEEIQNLRSAASE